MAAVTVREITTLSVFRGTSVLAGRDGLDRLVSGVNVMEVPDIEGYVEAGELLLTTGYPVRDDPAKLVELLPRLVDKGLSALAIKPLRYLDRIPDGLRAEADRLRFPVLIMPDRTSFNEVIGAVLAVVLAEYGAEPGGAEIIRERLTGVALTGGGLEEIAYTLAGALDRGVAIVDQDGAPFSDGATAPPGSGDLVSRQVAEPGHSGPNHDAGNREPWSFPVTVGGVEHGRILVGGEAEPSLGQRRLIRQACFAAGMHVAQALAEMERDRRLRVLFLEELVTSVSLGEPTLRQRSRLSGWDLAGDHVVLLARCRVEVSDAAVMRAAERTFGTGVPAWARGQEVVAILPAAACRTNDPGERAEDRWRAALAELSDLEVTVAAGAVARSVGELPVSHATARDGLRIAVATGRGSVRHDELDLERLMLAAPGSMRREFVNRWVGPLVEHDEQHGGDLCRTLEIYLGLGNAAEAARMLYVHYNTMKHRLARIGDLAAVDLRDPRARLTLALALELRKLL